MDRSASYSEPATWERLLRDQQRGLAELKQGSRIGVLPRQDVSLANGELIVWEKDADGITVHRQDFRGFRSADVDLLFVAEEEILAGLCDGTDREPIGRLKEGYKRASIVVYFLKSKRDLITLGYEDFVDYMGLPLTGCV